MELQAQLFYCALDQVYHSELPLAGNTTEVLERIQQQHFEEDPYSGEAGAGTGRSVWLMVGARGVPSSSQTSWTEILSRSSWLMLSLMNWTVKVRWNRRSCRFSELNLKLIGNLFIFISKCENLSYLHDTSEIIKQE